MGVVLNWSSDYPTTIDDLITNFPELSDGVHDVLDSHVNELASAVVALQTVAGGFRTTPIADPLSPSDGDVLTYNLGANEWRAVTPGSLSSLQAAYEGGNTIAVEAAEGSVALSNGVDTTNLLTLTRTFADAGQILAMVMGAGTTGDAINIADSGDGNSLDIDKIGTTGLAFRVSDGGSPVFTIDHAGVITALNPVLGPDGSAGAPSFAFSSSTTSGLFRPNLNQVSLAAGGVEALRATATQLRVAFSGTAGAPAVTFNTQPDMGVYLVNSETLGFATSGVASMLLKSNLDDATGDEVMFDFAGVVNKATSGSWTGIRFNFTDTSSPENTNYWIRLQTGGADRFRIEDFFDAPRLIMGDPTFDVVQIDSQGILWSVGNLAPYQLRGADGAVDVGGIGLQVLGGDGGAASVTAGGVGGALDVLAGDGGAGTAGLAAGAGASIAITAGAAGTDNGGGGADGGDVALTAGLATGAGADGDVTFTARSATTPFNEVGDTALVGFTATSIIGALNELNAGGVSLDGAYNIGASITIDSTGGQLFFSRDGTGAFTGFLYEDDTVLAETIMEIRSEPAGSKNVPLLLFTSNNLVRTTAGNSQYKVIDITQSGTGDTMRIGTTGIQLVRTTASGQDFAVVCDQPVGSAIAGVDISLLAGTGAAGVAFTSGGGFGGDLVLSAGAGGDGATSAAGAVGGDVDINAGTGGAASSNNTAADGGVVTIDGGLGGAADGDGTPVSGAGGSVSITGGSAGAANGGAGAAGAAVIINAGSGTGSGADGEIQIGLTTASNIRLGNGTDPITIESNVSVGTDNTYSLGTGASDRFSTIWAATTNIGDLNLHGQEDDSHWTINESRDGVFLHDRKTGKVYKFLVEEVDPSTAPTPIEVP